MNMEAVTTRLRKTTQYGNTDSDISRESNKHTGRTVSRTHGFSHEIVKDDDIVNGETREHVTVPSAEALSKSWSSGRSAQAESSPSSSSSEEAEEVDKGQEININGRSSSGYWKRGANKRLLVRSNSAPEQPTHLLSDLLSSSRQVVASTEDFVKSVIQAGRQLVHHHELPDWLKDNEYLISGHRLPLPSFRECFQSIFSIHSETGNIWTHLLGMLAFIFISTYTLSSRYIDWMWQDITVHSVFFGGAILCLTFSWVFHTLFCHSEHVHKLFIKLDYCGIALLTVGSFVPWLYYGFYHSAMAHIIYLVCIIVLGTSCIVVSLFDRFASRAYRPVRAGLFIALGLTGVIPAVHLVVIEGFQCAMYELALLHLIVMALLYIGGALMYAFRIPEKLWPGKFDIWFQSHQIFHICVIAAALVHFRGIQIISHARLHSVECVHV